MARITRSFSGWFAKLTLSAVVIAGMSQFSDETNAPPTLEHHAAIASHLYYPEVRLRKLHLVRPDLIPYPIFYDIYC